MQLDVKSWMPVVSIVSSKSQLTGTDLLLLMIDRAKAGTWFFSVICFWTPQSWPLVLIWTSPVLEATSLGVPALAVEHSHTHTACMNPFSRVHWKCVEQSSFYTPISTAGSSNCQSTFQSNMNVVLSHATLLFCIFLIFGLLPAVSEYFYTAAHKVPKIWQYSQSKSVPQYVVPQFSSCLLSPSVLSQNNSIISELLVGWFLARFCSLLVTGAGGSPV